MPFQFQLPSVSTGRVFECVLGLLKPDLLSFIGCTSSGSFISPLQSINHSLAHITLSSPIATWSEGRFLCAESTNGLDDSEISASKQNPPSPLPAGSFALRKWESSYNLLFGKLALRCLFDDYFEEAKHFSTRIMLKPIDDPHVDLIATVAGPLNQKPEEKIIGNAQFRWQSDVQDPHTFIDLFVSSTEPILLMRSCAYHMKSGFGVFGIFPVLLRQRLFSEDYGVMGFRYGSPNLSVGATVIPFSPIRDRIKGETAVGFGFNVENIREASYQRADPNYVMLTPNKEHLAEGIHWKIGKRPVLQSDVKSGNFDGMPKELRPLDQIL
ncbi:UNVERIFIED_CONTAM: hypothetical protein Slati_0056100 [Sesamum latifolium]|uniref:Uncharacterized protein n=1 Tax=Sesamum latifolium TaxID=2727402 RepID=A0AAW2Y7P1_9LAMI